MNRRFLRWVLDITHNADDPDFAWSDCAFRWNSLGLVVMLSMIFLIGMVGENFTAFGLICCGGLLIYCWLICSNTWFFHKMRRKKRLKEAKRRMRWMLNATPYCLVGTILIFASIVSMALQESASHKLLYALVFANFLGPYLFTRIWIGVAITPFILRQKSESQNFLTQKT